MILIKKKKIIIITYMICVALGIGIFKINQEEEIQTSGIPCSEKRIVLDAGHGYPDEGAQNKNGMTEAETNLKITLKVKELLERAGITVILTRSDEKGIYDSDKSIIKQQKVSDIKNRVKIGNESGADCFVSIHLNKIPQEKYWGWQCFFKNNNEESIKLAKNIQQKLNEAIPEKQNKREALKIENIYLIEHIEIPITIVECGFISNEEEAKLLQTEEYQNKLALGIYNGIIEYFDYRHLS